MSPDWSEEPDPIPYAGLNDPQSLNLYSYAGNSPVSIADDDGHLAPGCALAPETCAPPKVPPKGIGAEGLAVSLLLYWDLRLLQVEMDTIRAIKDANKADEDSIKAEGKLNQILEEKEKEKEAKAAAGGKKGGGKKDGGRRGANRLSTRQSFAGIKVGETKTVTFGKEISYIKTIGTYPIEVATKSKRWTLMAGKSGLTGRRTRTNREKKPKHPYLQFEGTRTWLLVDRAIDALVRNRDIEEKTDRAYIVGYICQLLSQQQLGNIGTDGPLS